MTTSEPQRLDDALRAAPLVPVVVASGAAEGVALAAALATAGLRVVEFTLRRPGALEALHAAAEADPDLLIGAGTVVDVRQCQTAVEAGARFVVSPGLSPEVVRRAQALGVPVLPGVATPSEVMEALDLGLSTLKFFPAAALGGITAVKALGGPFPQVRFVPTGGIGVTDLESYLSHPAVLAVGGSWMVDRALIDLGRYDEVTRLTREALAAARRARPHDDWRQAS